MDPQDPSSWGRPPGPEGPDVPEGRAGGEETRERHRSLGLRQVRRLSNWTAVALVAATAVTAGYFARDHTSSQQATSASGSSQQATSASGSHSQAAPGSATPCVAAPVAVSGGSGVTAPAPAQTCAPGTGGGTPPTAQAPASATPCVTAPVAVSGGSGVTAPAPAQTCAPGTGGGTPPGNYVEPRESEGD